MHSSTNTSDPTNQAMIERIIREFSYIGSAMIKAGVYADAEAFVLAASMTPIAELVSQVPTGIDTSFFNEGKNWRLFLNGVASECHHDLLEKVELALGKAVSSGDRQERPGIEDMLACSEVKPSQVGSRCGTKPDLLKATAPLLLLGCAWIICGFTAVIIKQNKIQDRLESIRIEARASSDPTAKAAAVRQFFIEERLKEIREADAKGNLGSYLSDLPILQNSVDAK